MTTKEALAHERLSMGHDVLELLHSHTEEVDGEEYLLLIYAYTSEAFAGAGRWQTVRHALFINGQPTTSGVVKTEKVE